MREIKFRAWSKDHEHMVSPDEINHERIPVENTDVGFKLKTDFILMQFTGLKDKNGKEIYEGDILKGPGKQNIGVVVFESGCFSLFRIPLIRNFNFRNLKIIGNKFENPELLK